MSSRIWRRGDRPSRAVRTAPPSHPAFSGWLLFATGDPMMPDERLDGFEPVAHHAPPERHRSFDSIEDEAPDTEWRWDEADLEWRRVKRR